MSRASARKRARIAAWALTLLAGGAAALPILVSLFRALADSWMPAGDQGIIATRAYDVFSSHTPLVGQYSLVSGVTGHLTYSPGPMLYWLIALPARFGSPHAIALTIGLANALAALAIVWLARRRGGVVLMLAVAVSLALMCRSFMPEALHDNWNPSAGLLPFALLVFLCWSLACGEHRLLPAVAVVGSFVAQCQVAFLAPAVGLVAVGVVGLAVSRRAHPVERQGQPSDGKPAAAGRGRLSRRARRGRVWPWALAALVLLAACWTPPAIEELQHSPGNLTLLYRAATRHSHTMGTTAGWRAVVRAVGVPPRWLRLPSDPFDTRTADATTAPSGAATASAVAILVALLAAGVLAAWRRRADLAWASLIGLLLCAAFAAVAANTPTSSVKVLGYTLWWGSVAGMWVWLTLAWSLTAVLAGVLPSVRPALAYGVGAVAALAISAAVSLGRPRDAHSAEYRPIASIASQTMRSPLPPHATVWLRSTLSGVASPLSQAIKFLLRRHGLRILQRGATARLGPWYELDHRSYRYVVYAYDGSRAPDPKAHVWARVALDESRAPFPGAPTAHRQRVVTISWAPVPAARRRSSR